MHQKTIKKITEYKGIGLHTNKQTRMVFQPAPPNSGIRFRRVDSPGKPEIPARYDHYIETPIMCSTVGRNGAQVRLIEHLMSVLCAFEIDNLVIEIDNEEPPFDDGSAMMFVSLIKEAGIEKQKEPRRFITLSHPVVYKDGGVEMTAFPADSFRATFFASYPHPLIGNQSFTLEVTKENFIKELASAQTFCFEKDVKNMLDWGLLKGGTIKSSLVFGEKGLVCGKMNHPDDPARHKLLDLIGDLYLLGAPLKAHVTASRSGHNSHARFVKLIRKEIES